jgi:hypothetical protein
VWKLDARTLRPRGLPVAGQPRTDAFALAPDDRTLATTSAVGTTQLWDIASDRPIGSQLTDGAGPAHGLAGRSLTRAEWRAALPERPYAPACA